MNPNHLIQSICLLNIDNMIYSLAFVLLLAGRFEIFCYSYLFDSCLIFLSYLVSTTAKSISNVMESTERPDLPDHDDCDDRDIRFEEKTEMSENLRSDLIEAICDSERDHRDDRRPDVTYEEICTSIRLRFESQHGIYWSCVVGPHFIKAWHTTGTYAHFRYRDTVWHFWRIY